jgi:hypothetical protein
LPGEEVAERCYRALVAAEDAAAGGKAVAVRDAVSTAMPVEVPETTPPALRQAIDHMAAVMDEAQRDPAGICGAGSSRWLAASQRARRSVVRMSLELRVVVSIDR